MNKNYQIIFKPVKVICIKEAFSKSLLTVGKIYDLNFELSGLYTVVCDTRARWAMIDYRKYFKPLSEQRNERIDQILSS